MSAQLLLREFARVGEAPGAVAYLRRFVLDLAVQGQVVPQDAGDVPASITLNDGGVPLGRFLTPFPSPRGWSWIPLGSLMRADARSVNPAETPDQTFCLWSVPSFLDGRPEIISGRDIGSTKREHVHGDVLLSKINPHLNRVWLTGGFEEYRQIASSEWIPLDPHGLSRKLLRYFLMSPYFLSEFCSILTGIGGSLRRVRPADAAQKRLPIPPVAEQHRIVAKVDELMGLCDELEAAQTHREARRDRLRATSLRNLVAPEEPKENARFFLRHSARMITRPEHVAGVRQAILDLAVRGRLVRREGDWIPSNLGAVGRWGSGGTPATGTREFYGGSIPWIVIGDLNEGVVTKTAQMITEAGLANSSAKLIDPGTVLIAMYGASVGKLGIAGTQCSTNQAIANCVPDPSKIDRNFLFLLLRSIRAPLVASAKGGAQPNISQTVIKGWKVDLPPIAEQRRIVAKMDELMAVCDELEESLATEQTERGRLLDALLRDALEDALPARELELLGAR